MTDQNLVTLQPGTVISGRYEVVKCLGAGSMGLVYACRHRELAGHLVAVKVLFPDVAKDSVAAARFRNEIVASYGVSHPNVVRAYEYFRDGDLVAYTMEFVGGGDLADRLASGDKMPISVIIRYLAQITSGVQAIHEAGIVHRDLKPENILLTQEGDVKITDFGIARTGHGPKLTEHGGVVGTIDYVSPEYLERGQVDARSDIYAIGVLGYEMITGQSPFKGDSVIATMTARLRTDPQQPIQLRPDCPPRLNEIILRAMERNPDIRYQASIDIYKDLQDIGDNAAVVAPVVPKQQSAPASAEISVKAQGSQEVVYSKIKTHTASEPFVMPTRSTSLPRREPQPETTDIVVSRPFLTGLVEDMNQDDLEAGRPQLQRPSQDDGFRRPSTIPVAVQGINQQRIEALSQTVYRERRTGVIGNMIFLISAVLIGIFVGFIFLRYMWPEFFSRGSGYNVGYDAGFEGVEFK
jgi:serine/threonine-protein kinase